MARIQGLVTVESFDAHRPHRLGRSIILPSGKKRLLGEILTKCTTHNAVVQAGRYIIRDLLGRGAPGTGSGYAPTHIALGTGTTAVSDGDTGLATEAYRDAITVRRGYANSLTLQLFLDTDQGNGSTYAEGGLFDNATAGVGNMLARATFTPVAKTVSIQLVVTWDIQFSSL